MPTEVAGGRGAVYTQAMWDAIVGWELWNGVGTGAAWTVTICLMVAGLVGCVLPILPGHLDDVREALVRHERDVRAAALE